MLIAAISGCGERDESSTAKDTLGDPINQDAHAAIENYTSLIESDGDPDGVHHAQRAALWHSIGDYALATDDFNAAMQILPSECTRHKNCAWLLATCPNEKFRDGKLAVEHANPRIKCNKIPRTKGLQSIQ